MVNKGELVLPQGEVTIKKEFRRKEKGLTAKGVERW
jgi:hypothetical protein